MGDDRKVNFWHRLTQRIDQFSEALLGDTFGEQLGSARELIDKQDLVEAAAVLNKILLEQEDHTMAAYLLGVVRLSQGDIDDSIKLLERALAGSANFATAMVALGEAYLRANRPRDAENMHRQALATGDEDEAAAAHLGLGRVFARVGDAAKSMREIRKALAATPGDPEAATALAELVLAHPHANPKDAIAHLGRACERDVSPESLIALGRMQLRVGRHKLAEEALVRALRLAPGPADDAAAHAALAEIAVHRGAFGDASDELRRSLDAVTQPALLERLGDVFTAQGEHDKALKSYQDAHVAGVAVEEKILLAALRADKIQAATVLAEDQVRSASKARVAALVVLAAADPEQNELLLRAIAESAATDAAGFEARLLAAQRALADDDHEAALSWLRKLLDAQPESRRVRDAFTKALAHTFSSEQPATDLYALASRMHSATLAHPAIGELSPAAARVVDAFDQPLLIAVMGEYSSGKSSFVNAFLGDRVLPMGITPTTATINVLKYGRSQSARIVYRDETTKNLDWAEVPKVLRGVDPTEAARVKWVEIMYPSDILQRVNFVDTPGLNSILPEHEKVARRFISQADAVVWMFSAAQAGKASERDALADIRRAGKRVVGVVNKIDRVNQPERERLMKRLQDELGDVLEGLASVSAQDALSAMQENDDDALRESGWVTLLGTLEETLFSRARLIKHLCCHRRLGELLAHAKAKLRPLREANAEEIERLHQGARAMQVRARDAKTRIETEEGKRVQQRFAQAYREAAREVLDLVRPRTLPFGSHRASPADRDYLFGLLEESIRAAVAPLAGTMHDMLHEGLPDKEAQIVADDAMALLNAQNFERFLAYARGHLRGGYIDEFFVRVLPKLELSEDSVYHALVRDAPDVERELIEPLARALFETMSVMSSRLARRAQVSEIALVELDHGIGAATDRFDADHKRLTPNNG